MISEWLAHGALHDNPGLLFHGFNGQRSTKGVILAQAPLQLQVAAGTAVRTEEGLFDVDVELRSESSSGSRMLHAKGNAVLATGLPEPPRFEMPPQILEVRQGDLD